MWPPAILRPATSLLGVGGRLPLNLAGSRHFEPRTRACPKPPPSVSDGEIIFNRPYQKWYQEWGEPEPRSRTEQPSEDAFGPQTVCGGLLLGLGAAGRGVRDLRCPQETTAAPLPSPAPALVWVPHPLCHNESHLLFSSFQQCEKWTEKGLQRRKIIFQVPLTPPPKCLQCLNGHCSAYLRYHGYRGANWKDTFPNITIFTAH